MKNLLKIVVLIGIVLGASQVNLGESAEEIVDIKETESSKGPTLPGGD